MLQYQNQRMNYHNPQKKEKNVKSCVALTTAEAFLLEFF